MPSAVEARNTSPQEIMSNLPLFDHHTAEIYHPVLICIHNRSFESSGNHPIPERNHTNHQPIVNQPAVIVSAVSPQSIDNPSTKLKNLSLGKRPSPRNNQTFLRLHAGIFQSSFCPALSESSDNRPMSCRIRQVIVNRSVVIVKMTTAPNRTTIDQRIVGIFRRPMEIA